MDNSAIVFIVSTIVSAIAVWQGWRYDGLDGVIGALVVSWIFVVMLVEVTGVVK